MKTFKKIIEQNQKNSIENGTLHIDNILRSAYYDQVNLNLEDAYCKLLDALLEYSKTLAEYAAQNEKIKQINGQIDIALSKETQNYTLSLRIKQLSEKLANLTSSSINLKEKYEELENMTKQIATLKKTIEQNINYIDNAPDENLRAEALKEGSDIENKLNELLGLIERIIKNYLSKTKESFISGYSGIIRTNIVNNLEEGTLCERNRLGDLVVAYANLIESLCPKLIDMGNNVINHQKDVYNGLPYEEAKMLGIINTISYQFLDYLQRAIFEFRSTNSCINGDYENKIMLLEIAKQYMTNGDFDKEKINLTSTYYKNSFGITPQIACDLYTLSRAKKEN